jgi:NAD(P)-dependent dehydrogenase (short-subunit alcohol dehydrogenase family)
MSGPHKAAIVIGASQGIGAGIIHVFFDLRAVFGSLC